MSGFKIDFDPKKAMMEKLESYDAHTLALALVYAKNIERYGIDVTQTWLTAIENDIALRTAFDAGYGAGYQSASGKFDVKMAFDQMMERYKAEQLRKESSKEELKKLLREDFLGLKIRPMHIEVINYRFNVGDHVIFKNHGVNPITYVIADRCRINSEPYYKIKTSGFCVPDIYEYCPEYKLDPMWSNADFIWGDK